MEIAPRAAAATPGLVGHRYGGWPHRGVADAQGGGRYRVLSGDSELVVCEIGQGGLAVAGTSGPLHQPLAAVEAGNKAGGLIAVGPGGLQVRAGRTDFEDAAERGMANACSCRRPEPPPGEHYRPRGSLHGLWGLHHGPFG